MPGMIMPETGHGKGTLHQVCPYASAASLAGIAPDLTHALATGPPPRSPASRALPAFLARPTRDCPPSQGPPIPA